MYSEQIYKNPHWLKTVEVQYMWQRIYTESSSETPFKNPHWWKTYNCILCGRQVEYLQRKFIWNAIQGPILVKNRTSAIYVAKSLHIKLLWEATQGLTVERNLTCAIFATSCFEKGLHWDIKNWPTLVKKTIQVQLMCESIYTLR